MKNGFAAAAHHPFLSTDAPLFFTSDSKIRPELLRTSAIHLRVGSFLLHIFSVCVCREGGRGRGYLSTDKADTSNIILLFA